MNSSKMSEGLLSVSLWMLAAGWVWQALQWLLHVSEIPDLNQWRIGSEAQIRLGDNQAPEKIHRLSARRESANPEFAAPELTVIVPACNEEASIGATLPALLRSKGVRLQVIAVNDRSTDRTGSLMNEVAVVGAPDPHSIEVVHVSTLPEGWLGKPHALAIAAERATADWLLFTDADVTFSPDSLALALRYVIHERADHLVLMPDWVLSRHDERLMQGAMHALGSWSLHMWRIADPAARDFLGVGAFNLVRRSAYDAVGGFRGLRMEVLEDLRFGWLLKRAGYQQRLVTGHGLASVRWAEGAWGVVRNLEKNIFALYRYRFWTALLASFGLVIQILVPLWGIWVGGPARIASAVLYFAVVMIYFLSRKLTRVAPVYVLAFPLGVGLFLVAHVRSIALTLWRGGVRWRGTLYSLKDLRANAGEFW